MFLALFLAIVCFGTWRIMHKYEKLLKEKNNLSTQLKKVQYDLKLSREIYEELREEYEDEVEKRKFYKKLAKDHGLVIDPDMSFEEFEAAMETAKVFDFND